LWLAILSTALAGIISSKPSGVYKLKLGLTQAKEIIKGILDNCQKVGAQGDLATAQLHSLLIADYKPKVDNILKLENPEMLRQFYSLISEILGGFNAVATNASCRPGLPPTSG
jgi:hypothetical protein